MATMDKQLGSSDKCLKCDSVCYREFKLSKCPQILHINIDRFRTPKDGGETFKVEGMINYPHTLDLKDYNFIDSVDIGADQSTIYDLYGLVIHYGGTHGGHLVSTTKNSIDGKWYHFDDSRVIEVAPESREVKSSDAVVLLYRRRKMA